MISRTGNTPPTGTIPGTRPIELSPSHEEVLRLFKKGRDTVDIAKWIGSDEARVWNLLREARDAERARHSCGIRSPNTRGAPAPIENLPKADG